MSTKFRSKTGHLEVRPLSRAIIRILPALGAVALLLMASLAAPPPAEAGPCERSARLARKACGFDVRDDLYETRAICAHISNAAEQEECRDDADDERADAEEECDDIFESRMDFCDATGERFYDPAFDKSMFTNTFDNANPYFPLAVGNEWVLEGDGETVVVRVLPATKRVAKVNCIVVNDVVSDEDGRLIEDTDDWYAQARNGDIYYCGENAKDYAYFRGDNPQEAELVEIDGSFKHGVNGAKAGILMFASPQVGTSYRQEFALGDAEDGATVLSTTYRYGDDPSLDRLVPRDLADLFCDGDCLVTNDFNLLEPGPTELKYYAPGVGLFLEVGGKEIIELVSCNTDPRCDQL